MTFFCVLNHMLAVSLEQDGDQKWANMGILYTTALALAYGEFLNAIGIDELGYFDNIHRMIRCLLQAIVTIVRGIGLFFQAAWRALEFFRREWGTS